MKTIALNSTLRQKIMIVCTFMAVFCNCSSQPAAPREESITQQTKLTESRSIKLAILLDTSNSMDGLIDQAKSQLWSIVNELAKAKCDNTKPELRIALYEYGNSGLTPDEGYIRMVTPLTNDLDQISEDLFSLKTNGGQEFCGHVIQTALKELQWSTTRRRLPGYIYCRQRAIHPRECRFPEVVYSGYNKRGCSEYHFLRRL